MNAIDLPALDGRSVLGFLAAIGTVRVLAEHTEHTDTRLSWDPAGFTARIHLRGAHTVGDIAACLRATLPDSANDGYLPGLDAPLPLGPDDATSDEGKRPDDRMRMPPAELQDRYTAWADHETDRNLLDQWITGLITDIAVDETADKATALTLRTGLLAPFARMTTRTAFRNAIELCHDTRDTDHLLAALTGWRRVSGYTGEYLDDRALLDSTDSPTAVGEERGVPGATWLALMALPIFRVTATIPTGGTPRQSGTGWQRGQRSVQPVFRWPIWRQALDLDAIHALTDHPALTLRYQDGWHTTAPARTLARLGVLRICAANRLVIPQGNQRKRVFRHVPIESG